MHAGLACYAGRVLGKRGSGSRPAREGTRQVVEIKRLVPGLAPWSRWFAAATNGFAGTSIANAGVDCNDF
jgi:hypothetical protein